MLCAWSDYMSELPVASDDVVNVPQRGFECFRDLGPWSKGRPLRPPDRRRRSWRESAATRMSSSKRNGNKFCIHFNIQTIVNGICHLVPAGNSRFCHNTKDGPSSTTSHARRPHQLSTPFVYDPIVTSAHNGECPSSLREDGLLILVSGLDRLCYRQCHHHHRNCHLGHYYHHRQFHHPSKYSNGIDRSSPRGDSADSRVDLGTVCRHAVLPLPQACIWELAPLLKLRPISVFNPTHVC
jgi:hypothetical protein